MKWHRNVGGWLDRPLVRRTARVVGVVVIVVAGVAVERAVAPDGGGGGDECAESGDGVLGAVARSDVEQVRRELEGGADPDRVVDDRTALVCAVEVADDEETDRRQMVAVVATLLDGGADPDRTVDGERAPLLLAAEHGLRAVVGALLEGGADPNLVVDGGETALAAAAEEGHLRVVGRLLEAGADPDRVADRLPLEIAAGEGRVEMVRLLLDAGAEPGGVGASTDELDLLADWGALETAAAGGHPEVIDVLVDAGAELRPSVLRIAAGGSLCIAEADRYRAQRDTVEHLLVEHDLAPDGDARGPSPLLCAAWSGNEALVELLLDHGADPDHGGRVDGGLVWAAFELAELPAISVALRQDLFPFVGGTSEDVESVDDVDNVPPLVGAVWRGERAIAASLLDAGADPDLQIEGSLNALFAVAVLDRRWAVDQLLSHGAEPAPTVGRRAWTPATVARELGHDEIADQLAAAG